MGFAVDRAQRRMIGVLAGLRRGAAIGRPSRGGQAAPGGTGPHEIAELDLARRGRRAAVISPDGDVGRR